MRVRAYADSQAERTDGHETGLRRTANGFSLDHSACTVDVASAKHITRIGRSVSICHKRRWFGGGVRAGGLPRGGRSLSAWRLPIEFTTWAACPATGGGGQYSHAHGRAGAYL
jgi:hypothetical protein